MSYRDPRSSRTRVLLAIGGVIGVLIIVAAAVYALKPAGHVKDAGATVGFTKPPPEYRPLVLWAGDSYPAGAGASNHALAYPQNTSRQMDWFYAVDAQGATGFVNNGHALNKTYVPMIDRLPADKASNKPFDAVVIDTGRNDGSHPEADIERAAVKYFDQIHKNWPNALGIIIAPYYLRSPATFTALRAFEKKQAKRRGWVFIDPLGEGWASPTTPLSLMFTDKVHPNDAGQQYIQAHLTADFARANLGTRIHRSLRV